MKIYKIKLKDNIQGRISMVLDGLKQNTTEIVVKTVHVVDFL
jgi:hypothetical protein